MFSLIEALVERDEFGCLVEHIPKNSHFSFALTCHATSKEVVKLYLRKKEQLKTTYASLVSSVALVEWSLEVGCIWESPICLEAAKGGYLDVLKWARQKNFAWHGLVCNKASKGGHLEVLKWARENGCFLLQDVR